MMTLSWTPPCDPYHLITISLILLSLFLATIFIAAFKPKSQFSREISTLKGYLRFCYACFVKPHTGDSTGNQQDALVCVFRPQAKRSCSLLVEQESFYKAQADVYDATRTRLLQGREDMLALVAAQLKYRNEAGLIKQRPVWVDVSVIRLQKGSPLLMLL